MKNNHSLKPFLILWFTQSLSQLGSSITSFALSLWLYEKNGSSLSTSALTICSYAPYVLMSIFAGALTDRWDKRKTMLVCDTLAAVCTFTIFLLYRADVLAVWHLYAVNIISGLMSTVQQPASEVAMTLLVPRESYQRASALQSLSRSLISILNPLLATALYSFGGLDVVIGLDLGSFLLAFLTLLLVIRPPRQPRSKENSILTLAGEGLVSLRRNPLVFTLILFMAGVNLVASGFDAVLPGFVLPNPKGGQTMLGVVTSCAGVAMLLGNFLVTLLPKPRNRVRVVYLTMLFSLGSENFLLAFSREPAIWCLGQIIGWIVVPVMSANLDVILRTSIPLELQGRVYACRNTFQFFTIPIGLFLGGWLVDEVCEPFMANQSAVLPSLLFGTGKGSGAALALFLLGIVGVAMCLIAGRALHRYTYRES